MNLVHHKQKMLFFACVCLYFCEDTRQGLRSRTTPQPCLIQHSLIQTIPSTPPFIFTFDPPLPHIFISREWGLVHYAQELPQIPK